MKSLFPRHLMTASALALAVGLGYAGAQQTEPANDDVSPQVSQQAQDAAEKNQPLGMDAAQADTAQVMPGSFADLTEQVSPAVVNITTTSVVSQPTGGGPAFPEGSPFSDLFREFGFPGMPEGPEGGPMQRAPQRSNALGSGFVISADGYIVTNNHVIDGADQIEIEFYSGETLPAKVVGTDPNTDVALLKVESDKAIPFVGFGNSDDARVGDWVLALGNPLGQGFSASSGIVSARNRELSGTYDDYLQTDAAINRGNSGGPLFDMQGNVIGINNAIFSPSGGSVGIGFAIPAEIAAPIVQKLRDGVEIERGYLGVSIQPVDDDLADSLGIPQNRGEFIQGVQPGEAAEQAGIRPGDIVTKIDGQEVTPDQTLSFLVANIAPGTTIPVELVRDGETRRVTLTVGKRPSEEELRQQQQFNPDIEDEDPMEPGENAVIEERLGLQVLPLTAQIARQLGAGADTEGLVVARVDPNSDAARKRLQRGDIILTANYRQVRSLDDLESIIRTAESEDREAVLLRVQRRGQPAAYVAVRLR